MAENYIPRINVAPDVVICDRENGIDVLSELSRSQSVHGSASLIGISLANPLEADTKLEYGSKPKDHHVIGITHLNWDV